MVASTHWLASAAGMAVLERGGNAFDAAVAAGFVLQVVEPHLNGPGGEVPVIGHDARRGETFVVCGQGTAPAAATVDGVRRARARPRAGQRAAGRVRARRVRRLAAAAARVRHAAAARRARLRDRVRAGRATRWSPRSAGRSPAWPSCSASTGTSSAEVYLPGGGVPAPGSRFANPALAATYQRILAEAEAASGDRDEQIEAAAAGLVRRVRRRGRSASSPPPR